MCHFHQKNSYLSLDNAGAQSVDMKHVCIIAFTNLQEMKIPWISYK